MNHPSSSKHVKTIAIIGGGTSGLGALKALLDLPEEVRDGWVIDLYEQRSGVGGIWHPESPVDSLDEEGLPETPVYPTLSLNTVHPSITFPKFPFPPETPLLPHYSYMADYHVSFANAFNLTPHIHLSHSVQSADWDPSSHQWLLSIRDKSTQMNLRRAYDHLIVGNGHNHYPRTPGWYASKQIWEKNGGDGGRREVVHSIWYREPEKYAGQTVVVVGFGASGWDIATQTRPFATQVFHSYNPSTRHTKIPPVEGTTQLPPISHLTPTGIHFSDGTFLATPGPTTILLATGYELRVPFLDGFMSVDRDAGYPSPGTPPRLTNNLALIRPLHRQIFAIDERIPKNALAFIGLPVPIANGPSSYAQGIYAAHGIADERWLPGVERALGELKVEEERMRGEGNEPLQVGHRLFSNMEAVNYQNDLLSTLALSSPTPLPAFLNPSSPYTEPWRVFSRSPDNFLALNRGWKAIVQAGRGEEFVKGARTEEDYERVMYAVYEVGLGLPPVGQVEVEPERGRSRERKASV